MPLARQPEHHGPVIPGPLVLGNLPLNSPAPAEDKDQTVSRRFEPSSRSALIGEQPNPWDLLQPQGIIPVVSCVAILLLSYSFLHLYQGPLGTINGQINLLHPILTISSLI